MTEIIARFLIVELKKFSNYSQLHIKKLPAGGSFFRIQKNKILFLSIGCRLLCFIGR